MSEEKIYKILDELGIKYKIHHHEAVFTAAEVLEKGCYYPGLNVKNLMVQDKKTGEIYLVIMEDKRRLDFKEYGNLVGWSNRMKFADNESLMKYLGVEPGNCSVLGLVNDKKHKLTVVLCCEVANSTGDQLINFHPNVNTATVSFTVSDMFKFLKWAGNKIICEP